MNTNQPIGIFDSGIGGTSIAKEIHKLLPNENLVYLADSKNSPYGIKTKDEIIALAIKNTEKLLSLNAKIIVVACNTATTNAIALLRNQFDVPFIGIEPAIKPAAIKTKNNTIGILATKGTLASKLFSATTKKHVAKHIKVVQVEGKGIVEAIESNSHNTAAFIHGLQQQLTLFKKETVDCLVLGCTHYPYITHHIQAYLPKVKIIDSGYAVAKQTQRVLETNKLLNLNDDKQGVITMFSNAESLDSIRQITAPNFKNLNLNYLDF